MPIPIRSIVQTVNARVVGTNSNNVMKTTSRMNAQEASHS